MSGSATVLLKRAVELDQLGQTEECLVCYKEGIRLLMDVMKAEKDPRKKEHLRCKAEEYMSHVEKLQCTFERDQELRKSHRKMHLEENSIGHSYQSVMGHVFSHSVHSVDVEDPYIRSIHQLQNFVRFCEMLIKNCKCLKAIKLRTGKDQRDPRQQSEHLKSIAEHLQRRGIALGIEFDETLHDREMRTNNGWVIKIGRGLDYFKQSEGKFSPGHFDFDLRPCQATTVDIFHSNNVSTS